MRHLLILVLSLIFCNSCSRPEKPPTSLRLNISDDPASFDPRLVRNIRDLTIVKQLYDGLMRLDAGGTPKPAIAHSVEISDDQMTYTFYLREARWSNGEPVTAHDFVYAWMSLLDPSFGSDYAYMLYPIKNAKLARTGKCSPEAIGVVALDDRTLVVQLEEPTPYFLELTAFPTFFPVNRLLEAEVFNGPFKLKKWTPQSEIELVKNRRYWDRKEVFLEGLNFSIIQDSHTESLLFEKNRLDWLGQPISHSIGTELPKHVAQLRSYPVAGTFWFVFNTKQAPFNQKKMRQAFSYAINREEIISHVLQGNQAAATTPLPPTMQLQKEPYFQDGDVKRAGKLFEHALAESGWTRNTMPKITLHYTPSERNCKIVQQVQQQWQKAFNIPLEIKALEQHVYRKNVKKGAYQIGVGQWIADYHDPLAFLEIFKCEGDINDTGWHVTAYADLLNQSVVETNPVERSKTLHLAEKILVEEMPIAPLYHYVFEYVKKDYVKGVVLSPLGTADFKSACLITKEER